jgi:hypothetical protein
MKTITTYSFRPLFLYPHEVNTYSPARRVIITKCGRIVKFEEMGDGLKWRQKPNTVKCKNCLRGH